MRATHPFHLNRLRVGLICLGLGACKDGDESAEGLPVLGNGTHDVRAALEPLGSRGADNLDRPSDLEFNPSRPEELWVVNKNDDSVTVFFDAGEAGQRSEHFVDPYALHFMEQVTSISFGRGLTFGTCQDGRNSYNGLDAPDNFTGPTLWSSDFDIFAQSNPDAVDLLTDMYGFYTDLGSHLDMLHESPQCMGIAWEKANVYWVFDGYHDSINRYDFQEDHGPGYDDHSDGIIARWVSGEVKRVSGVVSHLAFDQDTSLLYVADTGNNRIAVLDTKSGRRGQALPTWEPGTVHHEWDDAELSTLVDGVTVGLVAPSGLTLHEGRLFVTDNGTGQIHAFELDGTPIDWADTGLGEGALAGLRARGDELFFVDQQADALYRLRPQ